MRRDQTDPPRHREPFCAGWRFRRGDAPDAGEALSYQAMRDHVMATGVELINAGIREKPRRPPGNPGAGVSFVQPSFDDGAWRALDLPHDWGIEGPFDQALPGETGKLPWAGAGWYRKRFRLPAPSVGQRVHLAVDGAMAYSAFWLNGEFLGGWPYGYSSFRLELTPFLAPDGENLLAVRLENPPNSSRWYPGSGLYRNVWLETTGTVRIAFDRHVVTTPRITAKRALVSVRATIESADDEKLTLTMKTRLHRVKKDGRLGETVLAESPADTFEIDPERAREATRSNLVTLEKPELWDVGEGNLYAAVTSLFRGDRRVDVVESRFGVRSVAFDAERGFILNGRRVPLKGVCLHHDLGALGTAVNARALERQLEILEEMGVNAIRTSHNPPAPELLELCDRRGVLVMDEAFDCWRRGKKWPDGMAETAPDVHYFDYAKVFDDWHERDLRALVRRDRNHPSVVMWSIGNEVIEQWFSDGPELAHRLAGIVREEDRTRPVTSAFNNEKAGAMGFEHAVDVFGFNYKPHAYAEFHERHPTIPTLGSETSSAVSSRGEYFFPVEPANKRHGRVNFQVSSYDLSTADWALIPDDEFRGLDQSPFAAGEFVWTGFDYLGEPTPYNSDVTNVLNFSDPAERERAERELAELGKLRVPSRSSYFGIIDLCGFPKDRYYLYQARWRPKHRMAHLVPHWSFPERVGQVTPVQVYSAADEAELFLNGRSLGKRRRKKLEYRFRWDEVIYEPGKLEVVTRKNGKRWATASVRTAGPASALVLEPDRRELRGDGGDLCFVRVRVVDSDGTLVPRSKAKIRFSLAGPGRIVGLDNGDPTSFESFQAGERSAFNGLALAIVRADAGPPGHLELTAESDGLRSAVAGLSVGE